MSETEHKIGKLIPIKMIGTAEDTAKKILLDSGLKIKDIYESCFEQLEDEGYRAYAFIDDKYYRIESNEIDSEDDIFKSELQKDGVITFEVRFYNGGCSFSEAIECAVENMKVSD